MKGAVVPTGSQYSVSTCIPVHNVSDQLLRRCLESVRTASRHEEQVVVVLDGPSAVKHMDRVTAELPRAEMIIHDRSEGLVRAWNEGLTHSRADLIHILHCDDAIAPEFYDMARLVFSIHPGIVAMATASREPEDTASTTVGASKHAAMVLRGSELAQFLLSAAKPATGSFIYSRAAVGRVGLFSSEFEYCPDEEFALRLALLGPMAFLPLPLYLEQTHAGQHRFETWLRDDFIDVYTSARLRGAAPFDPATREMAEIQTARNVLSVVGWLVEHGEAGVARRQLVRLEQLSPRVSRWVRYRALSLMIRTPGGSYLLRVVRRTMRSCRRYRRSPREA